MIELLGAKTDDVTEEGFLKIGPQCSDRIVDINPNKE